MGTMGTTNEQGRHERTWGLGVGRRRPTPKPGIEHGNRSPKQQKEKHEATPKIKEGGGETCGGVANTGEWG